jgi:hypothetical protein
MEPDDDEHELTLTPAKAKALADQLRNARKTMDTFEFNAVYAVYAVYAAQDSETNEANVAEVVIEAIEAEDVISHKQVKSKCVALRRCWAFACWACASATTCTSITTRAGTHTPRE